MHAARNSSNDLKDMDEKSPEKNQIENGGCDEQHGDFADLLHRPDRVAGLAADLLPAKEAERERGDAETDDGRDQAGQADGQQRDQADRQSGQAVPDDTRPAPAARPSARAGGSTCMNAGSSAREAACAATSPQNT